MNNPKVSIIIPTKNSAKFLEKCLISIRIESYKDVEIILVDGGSTDETAEIAEKYNATIYQYNPRVQKGFFDAPHRRNYGVSKAKGIYVYYVDSDMVFTGRIIASCVNVCAKGADAVIIREDSFGEGIWAQAKQLERRCYWGDRTVEAPRFFRKSVWMKLGGLDESLGGGGDDWDMHEKMKNAGYKIAYSPEIIRHNEGRLSLMSLARKRFMYGRDSMIYLKKRPMAASTSYFPIRMAYLRNWKLFLRRPVTTVYFIIMRSVEYSAGFLGILLSTLHT